MVNKELKEKAENLVNYIRIYCARSKKNHANFEGRLIEFDEQYLEDIQCEHEEMKEISKELLDLILKE